MMPEPKKYRKRPVEIEAWRWEPTEIADLDPARRPKWLRTDKVAVSLGFQLIIATAEGAMTASPGDWVIKGIKGEIYPCKPDVFEATYDFVE